MTKRQRTAAQQAALATIVTTLAVTSGIAATPAVTASRNATRPQATCITLRSAHLDVAVLQQAHEPRTAAEREQRKQAILAVAARYNTAAAQPFIPGNVKDDLYIVANAVTRAAHALDSTDTTQKSTGYLKAALPTNASLRRWCIPHTPPV